MKNIIRLLCVLSALLLYFSGAWAHESVNVITRVDGVPSSDGGQVTAEVIEGICKLTAQPAAGCFITVDDIKVVKLVTGDLAQARRRTPSLAEPIELTAVDVDDPSGTTTYQFVMPDESYDVEVTADFRHCYRIEDATVTVNGAFFYTGNAYYPEVSVAMGSTVLTADKDYTVSYSNNVNAATQDAEVAPTVTVTGIGLYTGEKKAYFTINKATPTITFVEESIHMSNTPGIYRAAAFSLTLNGIPVDREDMKFNWESSDESILTFDEHDFLKGVGEGEVVVTVTGPIDEPNFEPTSSSINVTVYTEYGLNVDGIKVTNENRTDVMRDGGSVQYDGISILLLTDAHLTGGISTTLSNLTICLRGTNSIIVPGEVIVFRNNDKSKLTFTTEGNDPGTLDMKNEIPSNGKKVVESDGGIDVAFNQNLAVLEGSIESSRAFIGTAVWPFVNNDGEGKTVDMGGMQGQDLSNNRIEDMLFTLSDDEYKSQDNGIILTTTMVESNVAGIIANYKPGTQDFADNFDGLTIMVPAGTGKITLNAKTGADGVLCVQIGNDELFIYKGLQDYQTIEILYACVVATYIYIYNGSEVVNLSTARKRAAKKTAVTVAIRSVGVTAESVQNSSIADNVTAGMVELSSTDIVYHEGTSATAGIAARSPYITVSQPVANSLPEGLFSGYGYVSFIDLRQTSLAGIEVSRSEGPFKGVSQNTVIFLPPGNSAADDEPNVVVGNVCSKAVLCPDMPVGESFAIASDFTAQKVVLDRRFEKGQTATLCLPFDVDGKTAAEFGTFYVFDRIEDGSVKAATAPEGIKAHTPCLFRSAADDTQIAMRMATVRTPELPSAEGDGLYGVYGHYVAASAEVYRFESGTTEGEASFVRMQAGESVPPFQAYLRAANQQDVLPVISSDDVVTGIVSTPATTLMDSEESAMGIYDLQGRRVDCNQRLSSRLGQASKHDGARRSDDSSLSTPYPSLKKGLYIHRGRKVIVR